MAAREAVVRALTGLPDAQREVLVLHVLEGMEIDEVALVLNISENAVSTRLYRARRAMEASSKKLHSGQSELMWFSGFINFPSLRLIERNLDGEEGENIYTDL